MKLLFYCILSHKKEKEKWHDRRVYGYVTIQVKNVFQK